MPDRRSIPRDRAGVDTLIAESETQLRDYGIEERLMLARAGCRFTEADLVVDGDLERDAASIQLVCTDSTVPSRRRSAAPSRPSGPTTMTCSPEFSPSRSCTL